MPPEPPGIQGTSYNLQQNNLQNNVPAQSEQRLNKNKRLIWKKLLAFK